MACSIALTAVNGIVLPGQTAPATLRVTGTATQCSSGQVLVSSSLTANATTTVDPNGRFRVDLPITASPAPACGDTIQVSVECVGQSQCKVVEPARVLECCSVPTLFFQAIRPPGSVLPTDLQVQGVLLGCASDQVIISSSVTATTGPIAVDPFTGGFSVTLPLTTAVQCEDKISVTAACSGSSGCSRTVDARLTCPGCYGASVTTSYAACVGTPPTQPVTFDAQIAIPTTSQDFYWDFGDGTTGPVFTIANPPPGNSATTHPHVETHNYTPGSYLATLKVSPPPFECAELQIPVTASCTSGPCPTITTTPAQVGGCVGGKRTVSLTATVVAPSGPSAVVVYWDFGDTTVGAPVTVAAGSTATVPQTHDYLPGSYTALLKVVLPSGCTDMPVTVTVPTCSCTLSVQNIATTVGPCDPVTNTRTVTATAVLNNTDPSDLYYWQWDATPATIGLPASTGTTQQHAYPAPGTGTITETVTLTVTRGGTCVSSLSKPVPFAGCGGGCPQIAALNVGLPGTCTADRLRRTVTLDATIAGTGVTTYTWDCGDGSILTLSGSAGPQTTHEFAPGSYTVRLTADGPGQCSTTLTLPITVTACCPAVTGITASVGTCAPGATMRPITLSAQIAGTGLTSYQWTFGDGTPDVTTTSPVAPSHDYAPPGPYTATVRASAPGCPDSTTSTTINVPACPTNGGGGSVSCAVLLWIAMFLILIGSLLAIIGCILSNFYAQAGLVLMIIGAILFVIGWLLFGLWLLICAAVTACAVILAVRTFVMALIFVFGLIAAVLALLALIGFTFLWPCAAAAAVAGFNWGAVLAILDWVAQWRGCIIINPSGAPAASSASPLAAADPTPMRATGLPTGGGPAAMTETTQQTTTAAPPVDTTTQPMRPAGLGDLMKKTTSAMGIAPCASCEERAHRLNQWVPL
jgi:PKD repeat protein